MKGLIKNNLSAVYANAKVFSVFLLLSGAFTVAVISQSLLIGYVLSGIIGFSVCAIFATKNEFTSKWGKYKLTLPVKRSDIIKSLFLNLIIWLLIGTIFAAVGVSLSWIFHGCPFDYPIDILSMLVLGISISLFTGAIFFPCFCFSGAEKGEVFLIISLLGAFCIDLIILSITNDLLPKLLAPGIAVVFSGNAILLLSSLLALALSYPLTISLFCRREY